jgi:iron(III) transport system substrate-binding protein
MSTLMTLRTRRTTALAFLFASFAILGSSCSPDETVVVYTALDRMFSEPIFDEFERTTGIEVLAVWDTESTKTVGLTQRIRSERLRPRCDVFWNNEILNTLLLAKDGLLASASPVAAANYPPEHRDPNGLWHGFAARARVFIVNTTLVPEAEMPRAIDDLLDPRWKGRAGIAKPLFGTTASHIACIAAERGRDGTAAFLRGLRENEVRVLSGNKQCAEEVGRGRLAFALTDTDDAILEIDAGRPVRIVYPESRAGETQTILLPNTLALIEGAPNRANALRLMAFLLAPGVEERLARGASAQIPLSRDERTKPRLPGLEKLRPQKVDFSRAADAFLEARAAIETELLR